MSEQFDEDVKCSGLDIGPNTDGEPCDWCRSCGRPSAEHPTRITFDGNGGLYLPPELAYIGVAMDRRDAAEEIQWAFRLAGRARRGLPMYPWDEIAPDADACAELATTTTTEETPT